MTDVPKKKTTRKTAKKAPRKTSRRTAGRSAPPLELPRNTMTLDKVLGQSRAIEQLTTAFGSGRFHHTWIFSGPVGVGKATTAVALARLLLDPEARAGGPGGAASRLIETGSHPDLRIVTKELARFSKNATIRNRKLRNIPVDVLREHVIGGSVGDTFVDGPAYLSPAMGVARVFIVDEAELIDNTGQNAMLKTLEEPPATSYLFLITSHLDGLLPTVRSRAQHVRFERLNDASMVQWFDASSGADDAPLTTEQRGWLLRFAEGSPGLASLARAHDFHRWAGPLERGVDELLAGRYPVDLGAAFAEFTDAFAVAAVKGNANASKAAANLTGAGYLFAMLAFDLRERLARAAGSGEKAQHAQAGGVDRSHIDRIMALIDRLPETERLLASNVNQKHVLEHFVAMGATAVV